MPNNATHPPSYLWYDYETWGTVPSRDRIAQFAAVRTDMNLNIIEEPINLFCKPDIDTVIDPHAVQITQLSPLELEQTGLSEWAFSQAVHKAMAQPNTCTTGYNSIRFDDECSRFLFYRNLINPYEREWKNGNSRWDLLDVVRMTHALRPDGIEWPRREDGSPSFRLEHLTAANGLAHANAHDAVSDVKATIALAQLIRQQQPKLFDYAFSLRSKHRAREAIDLVGSKPHLHFSGRIPASEFCMGIEVPLMAHPDRNNEVIVVDIREDPAWLLDHDADTLRTWLYSKTEELPEGARRPPLKTIHLNRSPMVAPLSLLDDETTTRLGVDLDAIQHHYRWVAAHPELNRLAMDVFTETQERATVTDPEQALYSGFISDHDQALLNRMRTGKLPPEQWLDNSHLLQDDRLPSILQNLLARQFPDSLTEQQLSDWQEQRRTRLVEEQDDRHLTLPEALQDTLALLAETPDDPALTDTRIYLENRLHYWTGTQPTPDADNAETAPSKENPVSTDNLNDQLDLF